MRFNFTESIECSFFDEEELCIPVAARENYNKVGIRNSTKSGLNKCIYLTLKHNKMIDEDDQEFKLQSLEKRPKEM